MVQRKIPHLYAFFLVSLKDPVRVWVYMSRFTMGHV